MRKNCELGRYVLSKCGSDKKEFLSAVYKRRTQAKKHRLDVAQFGRSMVEMLGVLAIIGVLSVGGIAGYSKAMRKHKLNQHAVAVNSLINNMLYIKDKLKSTDIGKTVYYNELFYKAGLLPDGMTYNGSTIVDIYFNVKITTYYNRESNNDYGGITFNFEKRLDLVDVCTNIVFTIKENADSLWLLEKSSRTDTIHYQGHIYGNGYCNGTSKKCISAITLNDIEDLCSSCVDSTSCQLHMLWK